MATALARACCLFRHGADLLPFEQIPKDGCFSIASNNVPHLPCKSTFPVNVKVKRFVRLDDFDFREVGVESPRPDQDLFQSNRLADSVCVNHRLAALGKAAAQEGFVLGFGARYPRKADHVRRTMIYQLVVFRNFALKKRE